MNQSILTLKKLPFTSSDNKECIAKKRKVLCVPSSEKYHLKKVRNPKNKFPVNGHYVKSCIYNQILLNNLTLKTHTILNFRYYMVN